MAMSSRFAGLKTRWNALLRLNTSPEEIALGTAIGVFIAITPLYGFHTSMVIIALFLFRRANKIAMFLGTSVSNILTVPFITWFAYAIGRAMLGGYPPLTFECVRHLDKTGFLRLYVPLFAGSMVLGAVLAASAYVICLLILRRRQERARGISLVLLGLALVAAPLAACPVQAAVAPGEAITYAVSPVGRAHYRDRGIVSTDAGERWLVTFKSRATGFADEEKIYSDPVTLLPVRVERFVSFLFRKERLVEEYDNSDHSLLITKYVGRKKVRTYRYTAPGLFYNAVTLPFCLRGVAEPRVGWSIVVRIPREFKVTLVSVDTVRVPAGTFKAFHFSSSPERFHIWISADKARIPLKMRGLGQTLVMKERRQ